MSRSYQLEALSADPSPSPSSPSTTTTLRFVSPAHPSQPRTLSLPNLFLRDTSVHPDHVHPASQQRLFRTADLPSSALDGDKLVGYGVHNVPGKGDCLVTEWSLPLKGTSPPHKPSAKLSVVPLDVLVRLLDRSPPQGSLPAPTPWDRAALSRTLVRTPYPDFLSSDAALEHTLEGLIKDGICLVDDVPTHPREGGHEPELRRLVERIGSLRRTWYGDLWDVKAEEGSLNIAYTNLDLGLHMDLTCVSLSLSVLSGRGNPCTRTDPRVPRSHFDNPPRYQFLHSLQNTHVVGGLSYFVDTFALAHHMRTHHPDDFAVLAREKVRFEYRNGGKHTVFERPTFELCHDDADAGKGEVHAVNYSPPFQGPLPLSLAPGGGEGAAAAAAEGEAARLSALHAALRRFASLCDDPEGTWRWSHQLEPGQCVVFDNRRVLHARTAFEFVRPGGSGAGAGEGGKEEEAGRWLKGAYMDGDELWSKWRVLKAEREARADNESKRGRTLFV